MKGKGGKVGRKKLRGGGKVGIMKGRGGKVGIMKESWDKVGSMVV